MATTRTMAPHNTTSLTAANAPIGLTKGGPKGSTSYDGWSATQVWQARAEAMRYFGLITANI